MIKTAVANINEMRTKTVKTKRLILIPFILLVCLASVFMSGSTYYPSIDYYYGVNYDGTYIWSADYDESIDSVQYIDGSPSLPSGMGVYTDGANIVLYGTPWQEGTFHVRLFAETSLRRVVLELEVYIKHNPDYDPKPTPSQKNPPRITKSPAGETVEAGGSAVFISRAENYSGIAWYLVRSDYGSYIPLDSIGAYFEGAWANNIYTEKVTIGGIPKSMNGWMICCMFNNSYGETYSNAAPIYVKSKTNPTPAPTATPAPTPTPTPISKPVISTQPVAVTNAVMGQSCTLSVAAYSPDSGSLKYQWFETDTNNIATVVPVIAAESSTFVVPQSEGTRYYCVGIINTKGDESTQILSDLIPVTFVRPEQPVETPSAATPAPTPADNPIPTQPAAPSNAGTSFLLYAVIGLLFAIVIIMGIALLKRGKH